MAFVDHTLYSVFCLGRPGWTWYSRYEQNCVVASHARLHEMVLQVSVTKYFDLIFFFAIVVSSPSTELLYLAAFSAARPQVDHTLQSSRGGLGTHSRPNPAVQLVGVLQGRPLVFELGMVGVARGNKIDHTKGGETCPDSTRELHDVGVERRR